MEGLEDGPPRAEESPSKIGDVSQGWVLPVLGWRYLGRMPIAEVPPELQETVDHLWLRLSQDLKDLLRAVTQFVTPVTTIEIAVHTHQDPVSLRLRLLLLASTVEAVQAQFPTSPPIFEMQADGDPASRWVMSRQAAEAVISKVLADEQDHNSPTQPPPWRQ